MWQVGRLDLSVCPLWNEVSNSVVSLIGKRFAGRLGFRAVRLAGSDTNRSQTVQPSVECIQTPHVLNIPKKYTASSSLIRRRRQQQQQQQTTAATTTTTTTTQLHQTITLFLLRRKRFVEKRPSQQDYRIK